jgi:proteasome lid subunit RPN8/RPN11
MSASEGGRIIRIPRLLWAGVISQLRRRGAARRESGAFLLGVPGDNPKACDCLYYDDLDPHALESGAVNFHAEGYARLWQACRERGVDVLVDIHTHPGADVRQSPIDQRHPMVPTVGHTALIVPHLARTTKWSLEAVGVYEYLGNFRWKAHTVKVSPRRVVLCWW